MKNKKNRGRKNTNKQFSEVEEWRSFINYVLYILYTQRAVVRAARSNHLREKDLKGGGRAYWHNL